MTVIIRNAEGEPSGNITTPTQLREFSVLVSVRIDNDRAGAERSLRTAIQDMIMMIPDVVDMNVDTIVEVQP